MPKSMKLARTEDVPSPVENSKGNVLLVGNSGVGKSTLIKSILGDETIKATYGVAGTTTKLDRYESDLINFGLIDTIGFTPDFLGSVKAIIAVQKWSADSAKSEDRNKRVNLIWFCVDGTASKLFPETLKKLSQATGMWKHVPVIVVITKSYSEPDREKNIQMVEQALAKDKRLREVVKAIVPVVAENYVINAQAFAPVDGVSQLIELTNRYMPEGISESEKDIAEYIRKRKGYFAHGIVVAATGVAAGLGFAPLPFSDALVLSPTEFAEIRALAQLYGISDDDDSKQMIDTIVNVGTVGVAAKAAISAIKAIPGINIAAGVLNAIIAGSFAFAIGEGSAYIFEQIYLGNKSTNDIDWVKKVINEELANGFVEKVAKVVTVASEMDNKSDWLKLIPGLINDVFYAQKKAAPASEAPTS